MWAPEVLSENWDHLVKKGHLLLRYIVLRVLLSHIVHHNIWYGNSQYIYSYRETVYTLIRFFPKPYTLFFSLLSSLLLFFFFFILTAGFKDSSPSLFSRIALSPQIDQWSWCKAYWNINETSTKEVLRGGLGIWECPPRHGNQTDILDDCKTYFVELVVVDACPIYTTHMEPIQMLFGCR